MDNHDQDNNAELWQKFQSARETLFSQTDFCARYKAPVSSRAPPAADPVVTQPLRLTEESLKSLNQGGEDVNHVSLSPRPCSEVTNIPCHRSVADTADWNPGDSKTASSKGKHPVTTNAEPHDSPQSVPPPIDHDLETSPNETRVEAGLKQIGGKMNNSETSDEVILTGTRPKHMRQPKALQPPTFQEAPEVPIVHISREKKKKPMPVKTQTRQMEATPEIKEELRRLTEEIRGGIGNRKAKTEDEMGTNAAALKSARSGPGVDPDSEVYQRIASRSKVDRANEKRFEFPEGLPDEKTRKLQWILYKDDTRAYPEIQSGRVVFNEHPPARQSTIPAPGCVFGELPPCPTTEEIIKSVNWRNWEATNKRIVDEGSEHANWRFNRSSYEPDEGFSKWLFSWLDSTMHMCHYVDIYHRAFFDGIAHPDGMQDMFIPHFKYVEAISPPEDDETKLHAYEIVDGYRWNYMNNKALKNRATKNDSRAQYLSSMRSPASPAPISPKANIYLRAAANGDISELSLLYNWYVHNSPQCVDLNPVDDAAMRQRIQHSRTDQLPFVVAAERQTGKATRSNRVRNERLLGFVSLTDFMGVDTIGERTAEVKIFVHPGNKGKGVGRCLMDKVMELCDPSYSSRGGYFFESGKLSYRSLGFLIIAMSYPQHEPAEYHRVKEWLQKAHQFEEQGLLKGVARKGSKQLNVGYLVREMNPFLQL